MTAVQKPLTTYADYLASERASLEKHEYLRGEVFAMAGGTLEHARLQASVSGELRSALAGRPCNVYSSDLRLRVVETDRSTYADVVVICGPAESAPDDPDAATNPLVIVEVLSDSSEASDRGEKFAHYRQLASLRDYLLVSQKERRIEVYSKADDGRWFLSEATGGGAIPIASLGVQLQLDDVYRNPAA
jgi:Uma2 family endonuclease